MLFEEYGRTVIVVIAAVAVLALLLIRLDFFGALGTVVDVNTDLSHSQGESALNEVVNRAKPTANFSGVDLHIYNNQVFQPLKNVRFFDADDRLLVGDNVVVTSILHCDSEGNTTELIGHYNTSKKIVVLNPAHYSDAHKTCSESEFSSDESGHLLINAEEFTNCPGVVTVTYMATDAEARVTVKQLTFVIDGKPAS